MVTIEGYRFEINLVVWQESISENSVVIILMTKRVVKEIELQLLIRNTVNFNHSVFVKSEFLMIRKML